MCLDHYIGDTSYKVFNKEKSHLFFNILSYRWFKTFTSIVQSAYNVTTLRKCPLKKLL